GDEIQLYEHRTGVPRVDAFAVLFQLAIEEVLSDERIKRRMRDDARFALLAADAVYYAPRMWRGGENLDVASCAIKKYLDRRRVPDDEVQPSVDPKPSVSSTGEPPDSAEGAHV